MGKDKKGIGEVVISLYNVSEGDRLVALQRSEEGELFFFQPGIKVKPELADCGILFCFYDQ